LRPVDGAATEHRRGAGAVALRGEPVVAPARAALVEGGVGVLPGALEQAELLEAGEGAVHRGTVESGAGGARVQAGLHARLATGAVTVQQPEGQLEREGIPVRGPLALPGLHVDDVQQVRFERRQEPTFAPHGAPPRIGTNGEARVGGSTNDSTNGGCHPTPPPAGN
jgi:hypothetical protein